MIVDFAGTMSTRAAVSFFTAATWTHVLMAVLSLLLSTKFGISLVEARGRRDDRRLVTGRVCFHAHVAWFATLVSAPAVFAATASQGSLK